MMPRSCVPAFDSLILFFFGVMAESLIFYQNTVMFSRKENLKNN